MLAALQALVVNNPDFEDLERFSDVYCPFEAVGIVRQEIRHGHFLAHCLDPSRSHGFGPEALRAFLRAAANAQAATGSTDSMITPLDAHLLRCEGAQVRREWHRIDLLTIIPEEKLVVIVELKIDASEHSAQLSRYREAARQEWPEHDGWRHLFLYVTRDGEQPSDHDGRGWSPLGLGEIALELDTLVERQIGAQPARDMLASYLAMLRRKIVTDERVEELAARLWSRHREALEFLAERRPASGNGVMGLLFARREELARSMAQHAQMDLILDHSTLTTLRFAIPAWDNFPEFLTATNWTSSNRVLLLEVAPDGDRNAIRARFVLGPAPAEVRTHYHKLLTEEMPELKRRQKLTGMWTRLGNETLIKGLRDEDVDSDQATQTVATKLDQYVRIMVPKFDRALAALRRSTALANAEKH